MGVVCGGDDLRQGGWTGAERRSRWSDGEKRSIFGEVGLRGVTMAGVVRRHDLTRRHLYQWRAEVHKRGEGLSVGAGFLPVAASASVTSAPASASVEILLANGRRLRGIEGLSATGLVQLIGVLEGA